MILNAEQLAQRIGPFDEILYAELLEWCQDFQDTIADLQRQLADLEILHGTKKAFDAYVQQRVDEAVLAATETLEHQHQCAVDVPVSELQEWYEKYINNMAARPCLPSCPKCKVFATARSRVQGKPVTPKVEGVDG